MTLARAARNVPFPDCFMAPLAGICFAHLAGSVKRSNEILYVQNIMCVLQSLLIPTHLLRSLLFVSFDPSSLPDRLPLLMPLPPPSPPHPLILLSSLYSRPSVRPSDRKAIMVSWLEEPTRSDRRSPLPPFEARFIPRSVGRSVGRSFQPCSRLGT